MQLLCHSPPWQPYSFSLSHTTERSLALEQEHNLPADVPRESPAPPTLPRLHRTVCPLALCWILIQTVRILQDFCNPETAGCALGAVSVCRRLVLGGVTALTNEAGCMAEHHLRPANLISTVRRNGRILKDGGRCGPGWIFLSVFFTDFWIRSTSELMSFWTSFNLKKNRQRHPTVLVLFTWLAMLALAEVKPPVLFLLISFFPMLTDKINQRLLRRCSKIFFLSFWPSTPKTRKGLCYSKVFSPLQP